MDALERLVPVTSCASRLDAELKRGALEVEGIRAVVFTDDAGGVHPELVAASCGAVRVMVPDHEADRARDLLRELDRGDHALAAEPHAPAAVARTGWLPRVALAMLGLVVLYRIWSALG